MKACLISRVLTYTSVVLGVGLCFALVVTAEAATIEWNVGGGSGDWNDGTNWTGGAVPTGPTTRIQSNGTVNLSAAATPGQLIIGSEYSDVDNGDDGPHAGSGTLNVLPGANLTINGFVLGEYDNDANHDKPGTVNQSGGVVTVNSWFDIGNNPNPGGEPGFYNISGGTLISNTFTNVGKSASRHGQGTLKVIGNSPTITINNTLQFGDLGNLAVEFGSGGVSTVVANSVVIWGGGNNILDVTLGSSAAFNSGDVFPILRGINGLNNAQFGGLPNNAIIQIGGVDTFRINYNPGSSNNEVTLTALRTIDAVPEPNTLVLLGLGTLAMVSRKPKRK
jgi:PEP-CTERM motif